MSHDLFNLYRESIQRELEEVEEEIQVYGRRLNNIRYADDIVLLASLMAGLQVGLLLNAVQSSSEKFGLNLNINKTKVMVMSKQSPGEPSISATANNSKIEQVQHFNYLGSWLTSDARCEKEIQTTHKSAESKFQQHKKHFQRFQAFHISKNKAFEIFVWPVLMHRCEKWTLAAKIRKNIEAAEMWFYRRILRIP